MTGVVTSTDLKNNLATSQGAQSSTALSQAQRILIAERIINELDFDKEFNKPQFGLQSLNIRRVMDAGYREQLVLKAEEMALAAVKGVGDFTRSYPLIESINMAVAHVKLRRGDLLDFIIRCENKPSIPMMGTANDKLIDPHLLDTHGSKGAAVFYHFLRTLADYAVEAGLSANNGGSCTGLMGAQTLAWLEAIRKRGTLDDPFGPQIMVVPLGFQTSESFKVTESVTTNANPNYVGPVMDTFLGRTPTLLTLGKTFTVESSGRRVIIVCPGGAGSVEELARVLTELKQSDRTTAGMFEGGRIKPPLIYVIGANFLDGQPFYDGLKEQLKMMHQTGASNFSDENIIFVNLENAEQADEKAREIVAHYKNNDNETPSSVLQMPGLTKGEYDTLKLVDDFLLHDSEFKRRRFGAGSSRYLRVLDAHFAEEVKIQAGKYALKKYNQYLGRGEDEQQASMSAVKKALDLANQWRDQLKTIVDDCKDKKTITIIGSGKKDIWNDELGKITDDLMKKAVEKGYVIVVAGDASRGVPEKVIDSWLLAKATYEQDYGKGSSDSKLVRFQLETNSEPDPAREFEGASETLGPALQSAISKSGLITALGRENYVLVYPHGHAEMDMVESAVLSAQLREVVDTPYRNRGIIPGIGYLNTDLGYGPFFAGKKALYEMMGKTQAAKKEFLDSFPFMDTDSAEDVINTVCGHLEAGTKIKPDTI